MTKEAMTLALEALEKLWDIIDDIDTYGDMAKSDDKLYRSLVERRQRQRFEQTGISTDGYELNGGAITALRQAIAEAEKQEQDGNVCARCGGLVFDPVIKQEQGEPVAWRIRCTDPMREWTLMYRYPKSEEQFSNIEIEPLYTTPQPTQKPWVGLTDADKQTAVWSDGSFGSGALWAEAKLKEKNE